ncbi:MAG: hypothetical protein SFX19_09605 [Alphaproteobacteria bacterium]|nr:hypothetical protein [Alphaproteobacteria bacterium]
MNSHARITLKKIGFPDRHMGEEHFYPYIILRVDTEELRESLKKYILESWPDAASDSEDMPDVKVADCRYYEGPAFAPFEDQKGFYVKIAALVPPQIENMSAEQDSQSAYEERNRRALLLLERIHRLTQCDLGISISSTPGLSNPNIIISTEMFYSDKHTPYILGDYIGRIIENSHERLKELGMTDFKVIRGGDAEDRTSLTKVELTGEKLLERSWAEKVANDLDAECRRLLGVRAEIHRAGG